MKRILIVEDEKALRDAYVMLFKTRHYKVYEAHNGKDALSLLPRIKPDIIVLDILMPVMGGVEFLETIKIKDDYPKVKILVLSNLSDPKTVDQIEQLGVTKYMLKAAVSPAELVAAVQDL